MILRTLTELDTDKVLDLHELAFLEPPASPEVHAIEGALQQLDNGRGVGVFDGDDLVGFGTLADMEMTVPGGTLPTAGFLFGAVSPIYHRRGVMTRIIRHQLHTLHKTSAEPLMGLTASEAAIYGRFGFGVATYGVWFTIQRSRSALRPIPGIDEVNLRLVSPQDSVEACEAIIQRQVAGRPGSLARREPWARIYAADPEQWRGGRSVLRTVLAERGGVPVGFARYQTRSERGPADLPVGSTEVREIFADDAAGFGAIIRYLTTIDLTATTRLSRQPVDSPLVHLLQDFRATDMRVQDILHLRLVDVARALAGRTYSAPVNVVLDISDDLCPWNAGRWHLTGDEKTAACVRSDASADLAVDIRELGAVYLGGTTVTTLAQAALVTELRHGALSAVSRAFAIDVAPHLLWSI